MCSCVCVCVCGCVAVVEGSSSEELSPRMAGHGYSGGLSEMYKKGQSGRLMCVCVIVSV